MATKEERERRRFEKQIDIVLAVGIIPLVVILVLYLIADLAKSQTLHEVTDYVLCAYAVILGLAMVISGIAGKLGSKERILNRKYVKRNELLKSYCVSDYGSRCYSTVTKNIDDGFSFVIRLHHGKSLERDDRYCWFFEVFLVEGGDATLICPQPRTAEGQIADEDLDEAIKKINRRLGEVYWEHLRKADEEASKSKELKRLNRKNSKYLAKGERKD